MRAHFLTLFCIFESIRCASRTSFLSRTLANLCLGCEPKAKVATFCALFCHAMLFHFVPCYFPMLRYFALCLLALLCSFMLHYTLFTLMLFCVALHLVVCFMTYCFTLPYCFISSCALVVSISLIASPCLVTSFHALLLYLALLFYIVKVLATTLSPLLFHPVVLFCTLPYCLPCVN